jgi:hypothetical protein
MISPKVKISGVVAVGTDEGVAVGWRTGDSVIEIGVGFGLQAESINATVITSIALHRTLVAVFRFG